MYFSAVLVSLTGKSRLGGWSWLLPLAGCSSRKWSCMPWDTSLPLGRLRPRPSHASNQTTGCIGWGLCSGDTISHTRSPQQAVRRNLESDGAMLDKRIQGTRSLQCCLYAEYYLPEELSRLLSCLLNACRTLVNGILWYELQNTGYVRC